MARTGRTFGGYGTPSNEGTVAVRATTVLSRLLRLPGIWVRDVGFEADRVTVTVVLRRRRLVCPDCDYASPSRYDTRPVESVWRHLDLGAWRLELKAVLRRVLCPAHGVRREGVPFARAGSRFTRDFEDLVGWLATTMDKTAICRLVRIDWDTVGRIIERVMDDGLDPSASRTYATSAWTRSAGASATTT